MKKLLIVIFCIASFASGQNSECAKAYYSKKNLMVQPYEVYNPNEVAKLSIHADITEIEKIKNSFIGDAILESINILKTDSLFRNFIERYNKTDTNSGINFQLYSGIISPDIDKSDYYTSLNRINSVVDSILIDTSILNVSLFYFDEDLDSEIFIYERGHKYDGLFEMLFLPVYNLSIESPVFPYEKNPFSAEFDNIGIELRNNTLRMVVPIVIDGQVLFNLQVLKCRD